MNKIITHKKNIRKNGFTLVELLFACAILGFMLTITLTTFIGVFRFYLWARTTRTTQEAARQTLNTITREVQSNQISSASGVQVFRLLQMSLLPKIAAELPHQPHLYHQLMLLLRG
jgi:prepilin-type N-terminal cleavage/methylation domain-containing protein